MQRDETEYGLTPEQYHAGVNKLWKALELTDVQNTDVFTLAANAISERHFTDVQLAMQKEIAANQTWWCVRLRKAMETIKDLARGDHHMSAMDRCAAIIETIDEATK